MGALVSDSARLRALGFEAHDLLLFLDAFDCIVQRPLALFEPAWRALVRSQLPIVSLPSARHGSRDSARARDVEAAAFEAEARVQPAC